MKLLGIDYGRRRIGLALSDPSGIAVRPLPVLDRLKNHEPQVTIAGLALENEVEALVFGVPLGPNDEETVMSLEVRAFVETVRPLLPESMPIHFTDESFSSVDAHRHLLSTKKKKARAQKGVADQRAACAIVEGFLREQESASW